jgi:hypothetical protein
MVMLAGCFMCIKIKISTTVQTQVLSLNTERQKQVMDVLKSRNCEVYIIRFVKNLICLNVVI